MFKKIYYNMTSSISLRDFILCLLSLISFFIICSFLQWEPLFEEGVYGKATLSLIKFGDFNVLPFMKNAWQVTESGYFPNFENLGITAYLFPFYLYESILLYLTGGDTLAIDEYRSVNILSNCFYTLMGLLLLHKILKEYLSEVSITPFVVTFFSTTLCWYTFLASTTPDTFGASYGIVALFFIVNKINEEKGFDNIKNRELFLFGLIAGFGIIIRIQLAWISIIYLLILLIYRVSLRKIIFFMLGILAIYALKAINDYVQFGTFSFPLRVYLIGSGWAFFKETFKYSMIGPNGYLVVSPSYLLLIPGLWLLLRVKNRLAQIASILIIFNFIFYITYNFSWVIVDEFVGRLQNDFYFLQIISLSFINKYIVEKKSKVLFVFYYGVLSIFVFWHLYVASVYLYTSTIDKQWAWQYEYWYALLSPLSVIDGVMEKFDFYGFKKAVAESYVLIPAFVGLSLILALVNRIRIGVRHELVENFFKLGIGIYLISTLTSLAKNSFKTKELMSSRFAISSSSMTAFYDDYAEEIKKTSLFFLYKKDCAHVFKIYNLQGDVFNQMSNYYIYDPDKISLKIRSNKYQDSNLENDNLKNEFKRMISSCNFIGL